MWAGCAAGAAVTISPTDGRFDAAEEWRRKRTEVSPGTSSCLGGTRNGRLLRRAGKPLQHKVPPWVTVALGCCRLPARGHRRPGDLPLSRTTRVYYTRGAAHSRARLGDRWGDWSTGCRGQRGLGLKRSSFQTAVVVRREALSQRRHDGVHHGKEFVHCHLGGFLCTLPTVRVSSLAHSGDSKYVCDFGRRALPAPAETSLSRHCSPRMQQAISEGIQTGPSPVSFKACKKCARDGSSHNPATTAATAHISCRRCTIHRDRSDPCNETQTLPSARLCSHVASPGTPGLTRMYEELHAGG